MSAVSTAMFSSTPVPATPEGLGDLADWAIGGEFEAASFLGGGAADVQDLFYFVEVEADVVVVLFTELALAGELVAVVQLAADDLLPVLLGNLRTWVNQQCWTADTDTSLW